MSISNWNGSNRCTPVAIVAPKDLPELIAVVRDTAAYPTPVRAVGELHSLNESIETAGTTVFMKHFSEIGQPDLTRGTVTVGAGVRMIDLKNALKKHGLQLPVVPEIGNATAGSVACCGTKDSSLGPTGRGQISSTVVGVRIVTATGQTVHVTSPNSLRVVRSSYGLLGIIYEVTFEVETRKKIWYEYQRIKLDQWLKVGALLPPPASDVILGDADGFLGFLLPYRRELLVERRKLIRERRWLSRGHRPIPIWDRIKLWMRTFAWTTGARPFNGPLHLLPKRLRRKFIETWVRILERTVLKTFFLKLLSRFASYRADAMIDFKRPISSYFDFTFWAFPVSTWDKVVPAYIEFCERFLRQTGFRPALPTEVYFIRKDDSALLSFCPDQDIFTLDMVNWSDDEPACWRAMNSAFNDFAAQHGGRPLLNQTKALEPSVAMQVWTPCWKMLSNERRAADPHGRFLTPFLRDLLP
jgi:FAD binding domain/D-arabinono-1,4-lactone oxidase